VTEPPKRGVSSRELKEKKLKPKADPKAEIQMKDESQRALKSRPADNVSEGRRTTADALRDSSSTRTHHPSSARQTKPPVHRESERESLSSSTAFPKPSSEKPKPQEVQRLRESDLHGSDSEKGRVKVKERLPRKELQDDASIDSKPKLSKKRSAEEATDDRPTRKSLDEDYSNSKGSLKRKARDEPESINPKNQKRRAVEEESYPNARKPSKPKTRDDDEYTSTKSKASSKRKVEQVDDDDYEPVRQKKPRPDRDSISSTLSSSRDERQRKEFVSTKKTGTESRVDDGIIPRSEKVAQSSTSKVRKVSPSPPTKSHTVPDGRETDQRRSSTLSGTSNSKPTKLRRKSPIYTSTEDEKDEDFAQPSAKGLTTPATNNTTTANKSQKSRNNSSQPLPSDDNLRTRYHTKYLEHLAVMQKLLVQRGRVDALLKNGALDNSGSVTDSEGELLPPEELEVLSADNKRIVSELQALQEAFDRRIKGDSSSD
jgi:RNA polymerase II elongation factor ELL